jgi:hypothetical protein
MNRWNDWWNQAQRDLRHAWHAVEGIRSSAKRASTGATFSPGD